MPARDRIRRRSTERADITPATVPVENSRAVPSPTPSPNGIDAEPATDAHAAEAAAPSSSGHDFGSVAVTDAARTFPFKTSLPLSQPGDEYELEADRVANSVMGPNDAGASSTGSREFGTHRSLPAQDGTSRGGRPLDPETRAFMEPRLGHDFGHVRIFADSNAAESARALNARAYTHGADIVIDPRQYTPGTRDGNRLLAHELTHVVQQRGGSATARERGRPNSHGSGTGRIQQQVVVPIIQRQTAVAEPQPAATQAPAPTRFRPPPGVGGRRIGTGVVEDIGSTVELVAQIERIIHPAFKAGGSQALAAIRSAYSNDNVKQNATNMIQGTALICGPFTGENKTDNYRGDVSVSAMLGPLTFERADQAALTTASQSAATQSSTGGITTGVTGTLGAKGGAGSGGQGAPSQSGEVSGSVAVNQQSSQANTAGMAGTTTRTVAAPPGSVLFSASLVYTITHTFHWDPGTGWSIASLGIVPLITSFMDRDGTWGPYFAAGTGLRVRYPGLDCPPE